MSQIQGPEIPSMSEASLSALARLAAETEGDRLFVHQLSTGEKVNFRRLWEHSERWFHWLARRRLALGARVVLLARNRWEIFPLLLACSRRGLILVPLDPALHPEELRNILQHCEAALLLFDANLPGMPGPGAGSVRAFPLNSADGSEGEVTDADTGQHAESRRQGSGCLLIYTSGTTGGAKGVLLSERNLLANASALRSFYGIGESDRFFCTLPTFHMNAILITGSLPFLARAELHLGDVFSFQNAKFFWETLARERITVASLVPSILSLLLKIRRTGDQAPSSLRHVFCGAAPLPADLWREFEETFAIPVYQGYGLTETTCWAVATPPGAHGHDTVGVPLAGCEIRIRSVGAAASTGVTGEVLVGGSFLLKEYFRDKRLTRAQRTVDGFLCTGDLGYMDGDGHLRITGRIKEIIIRNGVNIAGPDVDAALRGCPNLAESKTLGLPDALVGERVHSVCIAKPGTALTAAEVSTWLGSRISEYKRPDRVSIMGYLPRTATGKVSPHALRRILTGELAEEILGALTNCRRKRAQPSDSAAIRELIQAHLLQGRPLPLVAYWGAGLRAHLGEVDRRALDRLRELATAATRLTEVPARISLILTDVHALNNRIPAERFNKYFTEVAAYARDQGITVRLLSELWTRAGRDPARLGPESDELDFRRRWHALPLRSELIAQARKHLEFGDDFEAAARRYFRACAHDREILSTELAGSLFVTYNSPEMDPLLPELPRIYIHSFREGHAEKPWFSDEAALRKAD